MCLTAHIVSERSLPSVGGLGRVRCFYFYIFMKGEMEGNYGPFLRINLMMGWGIAGDEPSGVGVGG